MGRMKIVREVLQAIVTLVLVVLAMYAIAKIWLKIVQLSG